jgi:hypothetical protein
MVTTVLVLFAIAAQKTLALLSAALLNFAPSQFQFVHLPEAPRLPRNISAERPENP